MDGTPIFDELRERFNQPQGTSSRVSKAPATIVIVGARRVGKTTFVGSVSDPNSGTEITGDFGRITLPPDLVVHLFGTVDLPHPELGEALGAVVMVDARRIADAFPAINYLETGSGVPFIVAVNLFDGDLPYELDEMREALALNTAVPLTPCDARNPTSTAKVLQELVSYALTVGA